MTNHQYCQLSTEPFICDYCKEKKILVVSLTTFGYLCEKCYKEYLEWLDDD